MPSNTNKNNYNNIINIKINKIKVFPFIILKINIEYFFQLLNDNQK